VNFGAAVPKRRRYRRFGTFGGSFAPLNARRFRRKIIFLRLNQLGIFLKVCLAALCALQERLRLLCPAGGCAPINQPDACNLGKVSAHAVVGTAAFKTRAVGAAAIRQLVTAGELLNTWQRLPCPAVLRTTHRVHAPPPAASTKHMVLCRYKSYDTCMCRPYMNLKVHCAGPGA